MDNVIGKRIKQLREAAGMKQIDLAAELSISNTTLSQYESGARIPSDDIKLRIARLFNVTTDYLLDERVTLPVGAPLNLSEEEIDILNEYRRAKNEPVIDSDDGLQEIIKILKGLSPDNRSKLLELSRLYLNAQNNTGENQ